MIVLTSASPPPPVARAPLPPPLPAARGTVRAQVRAAVWHGRFVLAAACLGLAAACAVRALSPPPPATTPVVVLAHDVPAGTALTAHDLVLVDVPVGTAPGGAFRAPDDALGQVPAVDLPARLPLTPSVLADAQLAGPDGTVVVAVRLDDPAVAALLAPGLHLDLVAARLEGGPGETVARRALVRSAPGVAPEGGGLLGAPAVDVAAPVLVAVTPQEAVRIAEASVSSRLVAVVVR
ncbi:SAF domain protein [Cellulomonas flavigena DSM 20109]|uniref:SAF domain protein n=1 Tax=Cellulomonas flavigena (strain ATCC 482 / DSM 20109 / BCRC 11376 / JCM 18109 / NBRC 3775 / NCIMB 8073 / NRS 134) TaxID=446466 RepID=D5UK01_CELFN|nr:SAF domain-containing protein [Cellulomonas flavigena]ADG73743.1 SAF domain protein [Cellulomonas flavigena DSM 20109]